MTTDIDQFDTDYNHTLASAWDSGAGSATMSVISGQLHFSQSSGTDELGLLTNVPRNFAAGTGDVKVTVNTTTQAWVYLSETRWELSGVNPNGSTTLNYIRFGHSGGTWYLQKRLAGTTTTIASGSLGGSGNIPGVYELSISSTGDLIRAKKDGSELASIASNPLSSLILFTAIQATVDGTHTTADLDDWTITHEGYTWSTLVEDAFGNASNADLLTAFAPDTHGTGYTQEVQSSTTYELGWYTTTGLRPNGNDTSGTNIFIDSGQPDPAQAVQRASYTFTARSTARGKGVLLILRYQDSSNYYYGCISGNASSQFQIGKVVAGTASVLATYTPSSAIDISASTVVFTDYDGVLTIDVDGVTYLLAMDSDAALTSAGKIGWGFGDPGGVNSQVATAFHFSALKSEEQATGGGGGGAIFWPNLGQLGAIAWVAEQFTRINARNDIAETVAALSWAAQAQTISGTGTGVAQTVTTYLIRDSATISTLSASYSVITVVLSAPFPNNNLKIGDKIKITGASDSTFDGVVMVHDAISNTSFKYIKGGTGASATGGTAGGHYSSISAAKTALCPYTLSENEILQLLCHDDFPSGLSDNFSFADTDILGATQSSYLSIEVPIGDKYKNTPNTGFYINSTAKITLNSRYTHLKYLDIKATVADYALETTKDDSRIHIQGMMIANSSQGCLNIRGGDIYGVVAYSAGVGYNALNVQCDAGAGYTRVYYDTLMARIATSGSVFTPTMRNCFVYGAGDWANWSQNTDTNYCVSTGTAPGANSVSSVTLVHQFKAPGSDDYHLVIGSDCKGAGTDLMSVVGADADGYAKTNITGTDVGAYGYPSILEFSIKPFGGYYSSFTDASADWGNADLVTMQQKVIITAYPKQGGYVETDYIMSSGGNRNSSYNLIFKANMPWDGLTYPAPVNIRAQSGSANEAIRIKSCNNIQVWDICANRDQGGNSSIGTAGSAWGINLKTDETVVLLRCAGTSTATGPSDSGGFHSHDSAGYTAILCVAYDCAGGHGFKTSNDPSTTGAIVVNYINCVSVNNVGVGFVIQDLTQAGSTATVKNCLSYGNTTDFSITSPSAGTLDFDYNASSDSTATGAHSLTGITSAEFQDAANDNMWLVSGSSLDGAGIDESSFTTTDISGGTITSWPIGYNQYGIYARSVYLQNAPQITWAHQNFSSIKTPAHRHISKATIAWKAHPQLLTPITEAQLGPTTISWMAETFARIKVSLNLNLGLDVMNWAAQAQGIDAKKKIDATAAALSWAAQSPRISFPVTVPLAEAAAAWAAQNPRISFPAHIQGSAAAMAWAAAASKVDAKKLIGLGIGTMTWAALPSTVSLGNSLTLTKAEMAWAAQSIRLSFPIHAALTAGAIAWVSSPPSIDARKRVDLTASDMTWAAQGVSLSRGTNIALSHGLVAWDAQPSRILTRVHAHLTQAAMTWGAAPFTLAYPAAIHLSGGAMAWGAWVVTLPVLTFDPDVLNAWVCQGRGNVWVPIGRPNTWTE